MMPFSKHLLLFLLIIRIGSLNAQSTAKSVSIEQWFQKHLHDLGGRAVLMVYHNNQIVYSKTVNDLSAKERMMAKWMAKKQGKDPEKSIADFTPTTVLPIASCSKWLTAALVMTFVQEGKLKLNDTVGAFLPIMTQHGKGAIQISHCLSHLTGIQSPPLRESFGELKNMASMDEAVANIAQLPIEGKPGASFHYGNTGLQLAAAVLEKITRKSFEQLFQERIAQPCEMKQTSFGNAPVVLAAGGAVSSPNDYLQFLSMLLQGGLYGKKQVLTPASIEAMQQVQTANATIAYSPEEAGRWGYGFGEWTVTKNNNGQGMVLSSPGLFGSVPWLDTQKKYAAILFSFNLNTKGRQERYLELKSLVDQLIDAGQ